VVVILVVTLLGWTYSIPKDSSFGPCPSDMSGRGHWQGPGCTQPARTLPQGSSHSIESLQIAGVWLICETKYYLEHVAEITRSSIAV
jgi:hypothetical protein